MTCVSAAYQSSSVSTRSAVHVEEHRSGKPHVALKYFASGWCTISAEVDCSGCSWNSSDSSTPIRSGLEQVDQHGLLLDVRAGGVAEGVARPAVALLAR